MLSDLLTDPQCVLVFPFEVRQLTNTQETAIARCLTALYGKGIKTTRKVIPAAVEHAGKLRIPGGGDTIHACCMVKRPRDGRDASFVRYQKLVDRRAHNHRATPDFEIKDFWGQVQNIFILRLDTNAAQALGLDAPRVLFLAEITRCRVEAFDDLGNRYYKDMGATEVVDLNAIQCVVGRIKDRKQWAIIDRSGPLAQAAFVPNTS
ncbi:hypothetical protein OH76DRAFT_1520526 [Lentinus brumalis]|uniref:Uncharacterized protein n=1 Tax=Lentinus brumalis TaxID=2498619 RepID=A0A371D7V9_9APHY|nr:hypothetical protein OH76DRAFT_1520526 [Polyporus brumalis]